MLLKNKQLKRGLKSPTKWLNTIPLHFWRALTINYYNLASKIKTSFVYETPESGLW